MLLTIFHDFMPPPAFVFVNYETAKRSGEVGAGRGKVAAVLRFQKIAGNGGEWPLRRRCAIPLGQHYPLYSALSGLSPSPFFFSQFVILRVLFYHFKIAFAREIT